MTTLLLSFTTKKVVLRPIVRFVLKVMSRFHLSQNISLPTFLPLPSSAAERWQQTVDIKCPLLFYLKRTGEFRKVPQLIGLVFIAKAGASPYAGLGGCD